MPFAASPHCRPWPPVTHLPQSGNLPCQAARASLRTANANAARGGADTRSGSQFSSAPSPSPICRLARRSPPCLVRLHPNTHARQPSSVHGATIAGAIKELCVSRKCASFEPCNIAMSSCHRIRNPVGLSVEPLIPSAPPF